MITKYLDYNQIKGRLGNQLYYVLQAYIHSNSNQRVLYSLNRACKHYKLKDKLIELGLQDYICDNIPENGVIHEKITNRDYKQRINEHFTIEQLNNFISDTILKSDAYNNYIEQNGNNINDVCAIQIRNGDYLNLPKYNCFDRNQYLDKCLSYINKTSFQTNTCWIISDDNELNKELYNEKFLEKFEHVIYKTKNTILDDLFNTAFCKYRILFNSTFGCWSGFIGNCISPETVSTTFAPNIFSRSEFNSHHYNLNWTLVKIQRNNHRH